MKIYISSDIEGTCGACDWNEALEKGDPSYLGPQMTREVSAAASAAIECGADEVYIKDAHASARNITQSQLPIGTKLIRGWAQNIYSMMAGIEKGKFDAVMFTGYHSGAKSTGNPLSHTMMRAIESIKINGEHISEFMMNAYTAGYFGVPVCFI
ncbi:MAG: M55 family metallopeptidase, partial [Clostridia bacterium]|nr:M55 family metallopeptidase [Clostridia bacterium]